MFANPFRRRKTFQSNRRPQRFALLENLERRDLFAGDVATLAGRGQDLLLVVNPNDENALRIAGEYRELRNIPDRNIVFVEPPEFEFEFKFEFESPEGEGEESKVLRS